MKNKEVRRSNQSKGNYCVLLVAVSIVVVIFCTSCGVKSAFLAKRNDMMGRLLAASKENKGASAEAAMDDYMALSVLLDDSRKEKLEKSINKIEKVEEGIAFIEIHLVYQKLYEAWRKVLSPSEAAELKNKVESCSDQEKIDEQIKASLPNVLQDQIKDARVRSRLKILDIGELKKMLSAVRQKKLTVTEGNLKQIIDQESEKKEATIPTESTKKDDWGEKLPLKGVEREEFMRLIMQFCNADQKQLKALFYRAEAESIENFLYAFNNDGVFNLSERIDLLGTLSYLYKCDTKLCVKMCNDPGSLTTLDQFTIYRICPNLHLLTKLRDALS
ncbi:hypothetical protein [Candidatus Cardinium hertigii]|uniref:Uncharacterized protein n=1 Tax=Candidatus Cardinium hertigii TaxID=247481 RepID=A0A2Z3L8H1_9BACT|nr:hypothetical protein [Candidatus Cardinium hertigii]AWN81709.1 hypothetical protein DK880_00381 [Candidatus Cardinium hertigii]